MIDELNRGLEHVEESDRVVHDVSDYHAPLPEVLCATYTSVSHPHSGLAEMPFANVSGTLNSVFYSNKRNVDQMEGETSAEGSHKRSRRGDEGTSDELFESSGEDL